MHRLLILLWEWLAYKYWQSMDVQGWQTGEHQTIMWEKVPNASQIPFKFWNLIIISQYSYKDH